MLLLALLWQGPQPARKVAGDWAEWRGPDRNGVSAEKNLPTKWSPAGENLVWKAPYGGRSAPIVMGGRVFIFNSAGEGETMQERILALDAETGKVAWERRFNVYLTDVPPRRIAWSSPAGDPETGNVYVFGACNELTALSFDGQVLWSRALTDEFGAWTTHGGRTVSPIIDSGLVIVSTVTDGWGDLALRRHRYYAFDKRTGETVWISTPGGRPFDTTYSTPIVADLNGTRLMIAGAGDGTINGLKVATGEPVWNYAVSKRGVNPGVVLKGTTAFIAHQEENLDTSEMGLLAAVDATAKGAIGKDQIKWSTRNYQLGPATPVIDGDRLYAMDSGANLLAFDLNSGRELWRLQLGTIQKASPVVADGKIYVGTENGKFYIIKPGPDRGEILDGDELEPVDKVDTVTASGDDLIASNEQILSGVAVARGRIYLVSTKAVYCIGPKTPGPSAAAAQSVTNAAPASAAVAHVQVIPADAVIRPGVASQFRVRLFDDHGRFIREEKSATWALDGLQGEARDGSLTAAPAAGAQAGMLKATVGGVTGVARVRVIPPLPLTENFEATPVDGVPKHWINATGKYGVREVEGNKILVKKPDPPAFKRGRAFIGPADWSNYTIEADVSAVERRRQMGDGGVIAQRYELVLFGNNQRLELQSWQIEPTRTVKMKYTWKAGTWYRLKLRVENLPDGRTRARGKAWAVGEPEPEAWMIERIDPHGNRQGSPGVFADAPFEVYFDNLKIASNQ